MTIRTLGYIQFKTHSVTISKDSEDHRIYCFKHTHSRCDIESFTNEDQAADYIMAPFPALVYELVLGGDSESNSAASGAG